MALEMAGSPGETIPTTGGSRTTQGVADNAAEIALGPTYFVGKNDDRFIGRLRGIAGAALGAASGYVPMDNGRGSMSTSSPVQIYNTMGPRLHLRGGLSMYVGKGVAAYGLYDWSHTWVFFSPDRDVKADELTQTGHALELGVLMGGWLMTGKLGIAFVDLTTEGSLYVRMGSGDFNATSTRHGASITEFRFALLF